VPQGCPVFGLVATHSVPLDGQLCWTPWYNAELAARWAIRATRATLSLRVKDRLLKTTS